MQPVLRIASVTGVDLELRIAGPGGRSYAFVIDWHIRVLTAIAWFVAVYFVSLAFDTSGSSGFLYAMLVPSIAIYALYHPLLEVLLKGRTPGKRIAGVRLVKRDGGIPGVGALIIRNVFRLVDSLPFAYCIGLIMVMATREAVRIGDIAAGTVLVYDDARRTEMPSGLSGSAVERLGLQQVEIVRELLARWRELKPEVRARLAQQLLERLGMPAPDADEQQLRLRLEELLASRGSGP